MGLLRAVPAGVSLPERLGPAAADGGGRPRWPRANVVYYAPSSPWPCWSSGPFCDTVFSLLVDWLPENAFAFVTGLAGAGLLHFLVTLIPTRCKTPPGDAVPQGFAISPVATAVLLVVLIPLIEETLFRGLVFGSLRQYSRPLAYWSPCWGSMPGPACGGTPWRIGDPAICCCLSSTCPWAWPYLVLRQRRLHMGRRSPPLGHQRL